jgi:hypothetical protein
MFKLSKNLKISEKIGEIALIFFAFRDQLKIYHFLTTSYARHKTVDILVDQITVSMDQFLEVLQGTRGRLSMPKKYNTITYQNISDRSVIKLLKEFKQFLLISLPKFLKPFDKDLENIRDEILANLNQTLYLFTFN